MKALCITVLVIAGLTACEDDDFDECAEVGGRGGSELIAKCGELPSLDAGGTAAPPPHSDAARSVEEDEDAAVATSGVECRNASDCAAAPPGFACQSCMDGGE